MEHYGQERRQNPQYGCGQQPSSGSGSADRVDPQQQQVYDYQVDGAQYSLSYGTADAEALSGQQGQPSSGQYVHYNPNITYNIDQPQAVNFGMPDSVQYYNIASPTGLQIPSVPSQFATAPYSPSDPSVLGQNFPISSTQSGSYDAWAQQSTPQPQQQNYNQPTTPMSTSEQALANVQTRFRQIFTLARDDALRDAGAQLLELSHYLLSNVDAFDDQTQHDARIRLWDGFNKVWLVTLQRQLDLTESKQSAVMDVQTLNRMSRELIGLCDSIEKHGLVDYQMGVAEDEIVEMIIRCLNALNPSARDAGSQRAESSSAGASRRRGG